MTDSAHSTLPLPDYDHLPLGGLESRIRSLSSDEVETLLAYERAHAHRVPVVELLGTRLDRLRAGAEPTSGDPGAVRPEQGGHRTGSPVSCGHVAAADEPAAARHAGPAGPPEGQPHVGGLHCMRGPRRPGAGPSRAPAHPAPAPAGGLGPRAPATRTG